MFDEEPWLAIDPEVRMVEDLVWRRKVEKALDLAERVSARGPVYRLAMACAHASALVEIGRFGAAVDLLRWAIGFGADPRAARDLAVLLRYELRDDNAALDACELGLAGAVPPDGGWDWRIADRVRVACYELTTLYLRLSPPDRRWHIIHALDPVAMPLADRVLARAVYHQLTGDFLTASRLYDSGLAREPYHPAGLYDRACFLAEHGELGAAASIANNAIHEGERRLEHRVRREPALAAVWSPNWGRPRHSGIRFFQVRPEYHRFEVRLRPRPGLEQRALAVYEYFRGEPYLLDHAESANGDPPDEYVLYQRGDHTYGGGWNLHCALRRLAPLVGDTHWFAWVTETRDPYLDEVVIADGQLSVRRTAADEYLWAEIDEVLAERTRFSPDDRPLADAVAGEAEWRRQFRARHG